jgi:Na+/proline symporter
MFGWDTRRHRQIRRAACPWLSRSPASSPQCPTSRCSSSASRRSWRSPASAAPATSAQDLPLFIAFAVLAAYTYSSGLRAAAIIAFVKDGPIYLVIIVAVVYLPSKVGGWDHIFAAAQHEMASPSKLTPTKPTGAYIPPATQYWAYATLALGSALALFMYPHSITATLSSKSRNTIRRNAAILPAYSFVLGLLALLGWVAIAAGTKPIGLDGAPNPQLVVPQLFEDMFPSWFAGVAFAAIAIGALVPAAIMAIAAANLFTRNIYRQWLKPSATPAQQAKVGKVVSLVVKFVALVFVLTMDKQNAINFHLLGGIWILQTLPAIVFGLYTRWFHRWALIAGWAVGMIYGTVAAYNVVKPTLGGGTQHFAGSLALIPVLAQLSYIRPDSVRDQRDRGRRRDFRAPGAEDPGRHRHQHQGRLLRRRRRPAGQATGRAHPPGDPLRLVLASTSRHPLRQSTTSRSARVVVSVNQPI